MAVYHIQFDTKDMKNKIRAVRVEIREDIINSKVFEGQTFNIGLADDPLYPALQRYVKGNPR